MSSSRSASNLDQQVSAAAGALSCLLGHSSDPSDCRAAIEASLRARSRGGASDSVVAALGREALEWLIKQVRQADDLSHPACKLAAELRPLAMENGDSEIPRVLADLASRVLPLRERRDQFLEALLQLDRCLDSTVVPPCHKRIGQERSGERGLDLRSRRRAVQPTQPDTNHFIRFRMSPPAP
jgi:hypothetical protein